MDLGIENAKDLIEVSVWVIGTVAIVYAVSTYRVTKNQFGFAVITSCTERFQRVMTELNSGNAERAKAAKRYLDLCNEELFYFKNKYLPEEVIDEWLEGMIYYLPHLDENGRNKNNNPHCLHELADAQLLAEYPRIRKAFTVSRGYNVEIESDRQELISLIKRNIRKSRGK